MPSSRESNSHLKTNLPPHFHVFGGPACANSGNNLLHHLTLHSFLILYVIGRERKSKTAFAQSLHILEHLIRQTPALMAGKIELWEKCAYDAFLSDTEEISTTVCLAARVHSLLSVLCPKPQAM